MELTNPDAEDVAHRLEAAYGQGASDFQDLLVSLYADEMELRHVPALPSDGVVSGARVREVNAQEAAAIDGLLAERAFEDIAVTTDGDRVRAQAVVRGTLADGKVVRLPTDLHLTIRDGLIVGLEHHMSDEAMAGWGEVAAAVGMKVPETGS